MDTQSGKQINMWSICISVAYHMTILTLGIKGQTNINLPYTDGTSAYLWDGKLEIVLCKPILYFQRHDDMYFNYQMYYDLHASI